MKKGIGQDKLQDWFSRIRAQKSVWRPFNSSWLAKKMEPGYGGGWVPSIPVR
jgi:hypothetical protein